MNTILICLIVCTVYSFIIYRVLSIRINKKIDNKTFLKEVHEEINSLITQINETSDRNVLLIENRLERLNNLIATSDRSISNLKSYNTIRKNEPVKKVEKQEPIQIEELVSETNSDASYNKNVSINDISNENVDNNLTLTKRERILLLHRQGISPSIIATQTRSTIGEVELIISLSRG